jgi:transmembrane sensor
MPPVSESKPDPQLNVQIYQEACEWLITFRTAVPDTATHERLDAWLRKSPEHVRAYLEVSAIWEDAALHDPLRTVSPEAHIARARLEDNIVPLGNSTNLGESSEPTPNNDPPPPIAITIGSDGADLARWRLTVLPAALAASVAIVAGGLYAWWQDRGASYTTGIGEQRSITLADGSLIELNAASRIVVNLTKHERDVKILQGQGLFNVAPDKNRPFVVRSGDTAVRAVGTQFDVYRKMSGTTVTVLEGRVAVSGMKLVPQAAPGLNPLPYDGGIAAHPGEMLLAAGEQVTVTRAAPARPQHANLSAAMAWTQHRFVFDSVPLKEVVLEFNRYNRRQLVIASPALEELAIVGVFSSTDPQPLLRFLSAQPGVSLIEAETEVRIVQK